MCLVIAPPGAVPVVGGSTDPSVPRSLGVSAQKCRAAHGPRHLALKIPPRPSWYVHWCLCRVLSGLCWVFLGGVLSLGQGSCLGWCPSKPDPCQKYCFLSLSLSLSFSLSLSLSIFFCLFGPFVGDVSLFFPLSGAGETQALVCFSSWTRTPTSIRTPCSTTTPRSPARFCFFCRRSLVWLWLVAFCPWGVGLVVCFFPGRVLHAHVMHVSE